MSNKKSGTIVMDADKEKIEKLKKRWTTVNKVSTAATTLASSGFVVSLLSPFDFDGPVIEIVTAVVAGVGLLVKKISEARLNKLNGEESEIITEDDKNVLLMASENMGQAIKHRR